MILKNVTSFEYLMSLKHKIEMIQFHYVKVQCQKIASCLECIEFKLACLTYSLYTRIPLYEFVNKL